MRIDHFIEKIQVIMNQLVVSIQPSDPKADPKRDIRVAVTFDRLFVLPFWINW
jgi:hypothetical protein